MPIIFQRGDHAVAFGAWREVYEGAITRAIRETRPAAELWFIGMSEEGDNIRIEFRLGISEPHSLTFTPTVEHRDLAVLHQVLGQFLRTTWDGGLDPNRA